MSWHLSLENIAGIQSAAATLEPGVNAVRASNWQGKSSFLAGIETVFGTATPLTEGRETGRATIETDDRAVAVELDRTDGVVRSTGEPLLADEYDRVCAALFAFLGEDNEIRQAVQQGEDLEALLTRPLDFEDIESRIASLRRERDRIERELEAATTAADRLPQRQERVTSLESELDELRAERSTLDTDETAAEETQREALSDLQAERDRVTTRIERLESTVDRVQNRLTDRRHDLEELTVPDHDDVTAELESLRDDLREIERDRELLQSVFEANRRIVDEERTELLTEVSHDMLSDTLACWVCGQEATRDTIEVQLDALDSRISELGATARAQRERVDTLEAKRDEATQAERRTADLESEIADLEAKLAETEQSLAESREKREDLTARIDDLDEDVAATKDRLTELESEIKYTEAELADAREELTKAEQQADRREPLREDYESLSAEITELRDRKETVKRRTREAFSAAMDDLLERFETGFETARLTPTFELVVAREGRQAPLDALSEGERELLGFVAALAGHEAFDVGERVPVMLLDELGGLASDNLEVLVAYLADRTPYLVLTAYPEHADFDANELSPTDWQVISRDADLRAS
ncbi:archaea-specific SMC-related protein [Halohasta litorea]|uniref:Archaea-specific SMC-related protein n=1 Tax=Halohasta litorea TaxID=869891 RepID=A0ABD6DC44_9EURY|nr:archaea-specific SMC-related protein [Halohasta litorea]